MGRRGWVINRSPFWNFPVNRGGNMSETLFLICPFSFQEYLITGNEICPNCGRPHNAYHYIRGKGAKWYQKKDQWIRLEHYNESGKNCL